MPDSPAVATAKDDGALREGALIEQDMGISRVVVKAGAGPVAAYPCCN
jgi:hypothetical protein